MAAYAALVSLMTIIERIQNHPCPPICFDGQQVQSLVEKITFLQAFLESYSGEADELQSRVADAVYAAEDIIESHVVDQTLGGSASQVEKISFDYHFYQGLEKVIVDMDVIKKEAMEIKEKSGTQDQHLPKNSIPADAEASSSSSRGQQDTMVGFDDVLHEVMDKLTGYQSSRQIVPIVGMGGIGKTTLARNAYENQLIVQHFDIRAWVTISQQYSIQDILLAVLDLCPEKEGSSEMNEEELGVAVHKSLSGRRYLIVLDDMWSIEAWGRLKQFFPDNSNQSRIMVTTRLANVAFQLASSGGLEVEMNFLDEDQSWNLLCETVFGEAAACPLELEDIGKKIAKNCKGLPLSIVVVGGLLAKSKQTQEYWEYIAENLISIVNLEDNEHCLKVLQTSYNELPVHLKPCFLYIGSFPEDTEIYVSWLIKIWSSEGFLKPISGKSLEMIAEMYLEDLADRNLILVHEWGSIRKIKIFKIHDLLRDLCLREAQKDKFLCVAGEHTHAIQKEMKNQRRIVLDTFKDEYLLKFCSELQSASLVRSLRCEFQEILLSLPFRLMRVLAVGCDHPQESCLGSMFQLVNSRYLAFHAHADLDFIIPSSVYLLWNLQTLIIKGISVVTAPAEIWKMPQLRHIDIDRLCLPSPSSSHKDAQNDMVLDNLQSLMEVDNFKWSRNVVKRIPNIRKLKINCDDFSRGCSHYCFKNLGSLHKLESLSCYFGYAGNWPSRNDLLQNLIFPHSLKKLTLQHTHLHWEDMATKIGSLPLLQVLKLKSYSFIGPEWVTVEGQFCSLKCLLIECCDLFSWKADSSHFPSLEHLVLQYMSYLEEIPSAIGEIPTLQSIRLIYCSDSAVISAEKILEEQEELGNLDLQVGVRLSENCQLMLTRSTPV